MPDQIQQKDDPLADQYDGEGQEATFAEWKNPPSIRDLKQDLEEAGHEHQSHVAQLNRWEENLRVTGKAKPTKVKGRSEMQPKLIRKQAEWRYSALSEPFLSTPDLFNVNPISWEDKAAAQQNALLLNHQFNTRLNKVALIDAYVRSAVDKGTIIARTGWESEEQEVTEEVPLFTYGPIRTQEQMELFQQAIQSPDDAPPEWAEAVRLGQERGMALAPVAAGTEMRTRTVLVKNQPTVEICNLHNIIVDPSCNGDIDKAGFVIYRFETSLAELRREGKYQNLDKVRVSDSSILGEPDHQVEGDTHSFTFSDEPRKRVIAYEYWGNWDIHSTGTVEPIVATWIGDTLIRLEENPFPDGALPFVSVPYLPVDGSIYGEPDGELLEDNQKIIGAVTRGMIDIMGRTAAGQKGVRRDALDVTNRRKFMAGEDYEYQTNTSPDSLFYVHKFPEIPQSAPLMVQLQNAEAESLTGVKAFNNGISGQSLGEVAAGVRGALDAASKRELGILRRLANGWEKIARKVIAMNAVFLDEAEVVRVTNEEFVEVRRDDLAGKFDLALSISTAEEDNAKAQELAFMLQTVGPNVDPKITFMIMADIARLRKMPTLAKRLEEFEPQPDPLDQQIKQLDILRLQAEIETIKAQAMERQAAAAEKQANVGNIQADTDLKELEFVEQENGVTQARDLQKQGEQAKANARLEVVKQQLTQISKQ